MMSKSQKFKPKKKKKKRNHRNDPLFMYQTLVEKGVVSLINIVDNVIC